MKKLLFSVIASACCLASVGQVSHAADSGIVDMDIASYPLYVSAGLKQPLIMLLLGRDHSMYYEAYNDLTDLDEDGSIDGVFTPHVIYDGIFESNWCYSYTDNMFKMSKLADSKESYNGNPVYKCNGLWSGNFLNYITSSRMDIVKRILIGGQRFTMEGKNVGRNVKVHYRGTFDDGTQFDSSYDRGEPLAFVCGAGMMIKILS